jgi:hypothetical protein
MHGLVLHCRKFEKIVTSRTMPRFPHGNAASLSLRIMPCLMHPLGPNHSCQFYSGGHSSFALGMDHAGIGPFSCAVPDLI